MLPLLVRARFQILFHSPRRGSFRLSLTVLVHYRSSGSIQPWRMVPPSSDRISRVPPYSRSFKARFRVRGFHPLRLQFPLHSTGTLQTFGLHPVRSPLLRISRLISFPRGTEMFHFPRFASPSNDGDNSLCCWVPPFGHLRISAPYRLPSAFRRLARPSSPPDARASAMRAFLLDHTAKSTLRPLPAVPCLSYLDLVTFRQEISMCLKTLCVDS